MAVRTAPLSQHLVLQLPFLSLRRLSTERRLRPGAKEWLIEPRRRRHGLFKLPRYHFAESTVEKLASEIGRLLRIPIADVDLAVRKRRSARRVRSSGVAGMFSSETKSSVELTDVVPRSGEQVLSHTSHLCHDGVVPGLRTIVDFSHCSLP